MKRYRIDFSYGRYYFEERDDGDWVKQAETQAAIDEWKNLAHKREYTISQLRNDLTACQLDCDALKALNLRLYLRYDSLAYRHYGPGAAPREAVAGDLGL